MKPSPALQIHYSQKSVCNSSWSLLDFIILIIRKLCYAFCNCRWVSFFEISYIWNLTVCPFGSSGAGQPSLLQCNCYIHVVVCRRVHSFLLLNAIPLYGFIKICLSIYMLTYKLTISHFWLLKIKLLWIFIYKSFFFPVVLRYNWYTKICMKLYIWWFWTYVYTHVIITTVMEINIEIASKSFTVPFAAVFVCVSGVCTFL